MEIKFRTKQESNQEQLEDFLKLSGAERLSSFFRLSRSINKFPVKHKKVINPKNFILEIKNIENENLGK